MQESLLITEVDDGKKKSKNKICNSSSLSAAEQPLCGDIKYLRMTSNLPLYEAGYRPEIYAAFSLRLFFLPLNAVFVIV